jgi:hypothetical protein
MTGVDPKRQFGSHFSMIGVETKQVRKAGPQKAALHNPSGTTTICFRRFNGLAILAAAPREMDLPFISFVYLRRRLARR